MPARAFNSTTQPYRAQAVFARWDVVAKGWYYLCRSADLPRGSVRAARVAGQRLVVFRGADGRARCLDAFCAHMGTDLAGGAVVGDTLRCVFHHWRWDGEGRCAHVPALGGPNPKATVPSWAIDERFGSIFVWPEAVAPGRVPGFAGLSEAENDALVAVHGVPFYRSCHHHVTMINGLDPQHLSTIHGIHMDMDVRIAEDAAGRILDVDLHGELPSGSLKERAVRRLIGAQYAYGMRYADATLGLLTVNQGTRLFGRGPSLPAVRMIFAYVPQGEGRTLVQPIYVGRRDSRLGPLGTQLQLWGMKAGFAVLRDEDGAIYENIRFQPGALLPIDGPVARYIAWVNRLPRSAWSAEGA